MTAGVKRKTNILSIFLKENIVNIIFLLFVCYYFYQIHMDSLKHPPAKLISFSEAWENLKSDKYMNEMRNALEIAQNKQRCKNLETR